MPYPRNKKASANQISRQPSFFFGRSASAADKYYLTIVTGP
jgi:hypothetical protein